MSISLDDIDYFLAVAEEGQVRKAALKLGVSQPAITKGLQRLEKALGFELFERSVKGMTLTRVAEQFRQRTGALRGVLRGRRSRAPFKVGRGQVVDGGRALRRDAHVDRPQPGVERGDDGRERRAVARRRASPGTRSAAPWPRSGSGRHRPGRKRAG